MASDSATKMILCKQKQLHKVADSTAGHDKVTQSSCSYSVICNV